MNFKLPKIYPITDTRISGLSHLEQVERFAAAGATLVQLREKRLSPAEFYREAKAAIEFARSRNVRIVINDRVDIALALKADGVHLGQDDLPPEQARKLLGPDSIIGFSTHSVEQAIAAERASVDYVAIGPIFPTATKEDPDAVVGIDGIRSVRAAVGEMQLVAIGGITHEKLGDVFAAGVDSAAMISELLKAPDLIESRFRIMMSSQC